MSLSKDHKELVERLHLARKAIGSALILTNQSSDPTASDLELAIDDLADAMLELNFLLDNRVIRDEEDGL